MCEEVKIFQLSQRMPFDNLQYFTVVHCHRNDRNRTLVVPQWNKVLDGDKIDKNR